MNGYGTLAETYTATGIIPHSNGGNDETYLSTVTTSSSGYIGRLILLYLSHILELMYFGLVIYYGDNMVAGISSMDAELFRIFFFIELIPYALIFVVVNILILYRIKKAPSYIGSVSSEAEDTKKNGGSRSIYINHFIALYSLNSIQYGLNCLFVGVVLGYNSTMHYMFMLLFIPYLLTTLRYIVLYGIIHSKNEEDSYSMYYSKFLDIWAVIEFLDLADLLYIGALFSSRPIVITLSVIGMILIMHTSLLNYLSVKSTGFNTVLLRCQWILIRFINIIFLVIRIYCLSVYFSGWHSLFFCFKELYKISQVFISAGLSCARKTILKE